ncbi:MAG: ArnT family glycosyltransferase, partial [Myxococcales bacterium]
MRRALAFAAARPVLVCAVVAFTARLAYLLTARGPAFTDPLIDADYYDFLGERLARGEGFPDGPFWQPPLYPIVLGALYRTFGHSLWAPRVLQLVLGALTSGLAASLARRLTGSSPASLLAGLLVALNGSLLFYDGELLPTSLATFLSALAVWALLANRPLAAGACIGLGALAVAPVLFLLPVALLFANGVRPRLALLAVCAGIVLPATAYNFARSGEPILISANGGVNLWIGNNPDADATIAVRPGAGWEALVDEPVRLGIDRPGA